VKNVYNDLKRAACVTKLNRPLQNIGNQKNVSYFTQMIYIRVNCLETQAEKNQKAVEKYVKIPQEI